MVDSLTSALFEKEQARTLRTLSTPERIQKFLDEELAYNHAVTCYSPRLVLQHKKAHCMEGALLAAAALRFHGHPPLLVDLEASHDDDHVLAVYKSNNRWGALGKSNYSGLRYRSPIYRTIRELVLTYFDHYFNLRGDKSLRAFSLPVNLTRFDRIQWMTRNEEVWEIPEHLCTIRHTALLSDATARTLRRVDKRIFAAGRLGGSF